MMVDNFDVRSFIEMVVTVASAVAVVVTLKSDVRWLSRALKEHQEADNANFAELRRNVLSLSSSINKHRRGE